MGFWLLFIMLALSILCALFSTILAANRPGCENLIVDQPPSICIDCFGGCTPKFCEENKHDVGFLTNLCWKTCYACNGQTPTDAPPATNAPSGGSCGVQDIQPNVNLNGYIVGGNKAVPNSWPWAIRFMDGNGQVSWQMCGGTIINERWVVTAAHCVGSSTRYSVGVGYHSQSNDKHGYKVKVVKTIVHEDFPSDGSVHDDIALLKLSTPLKFSKYVQPACLPESGYKFDQDQPFVVTGWGNTWEDGRGSNELLQVVVPLVSDRVCNKWINPMGMHTTPGKEFCAGYEHGGKDACQGDSGGGIVFKKDNKWYQGGVVSWGAGCARARSPGVYTYISRYINWINEKIANN